MRLLTAKGPLVGQMVKALLDSVVNRQQQGVGSHSKIRTYRRRVFVINGDFFRINFTVDF